MYYLFNLIEPNKLGALSIMDKERTWTSVYVGTAKICLILIQVAFYYDVWLVLIYFRKLFLLLALSVMSFRAFREQWMPNFIKLKSK